MSKIVNGRRRANRSRENSVQQSPYGRHKRRSSLTHLHSLDDTDISYLSTPEYLRQVMNTSAVSDGYSSRSVTRTHSASEMASNNYCNYIRSFF